MGAAPPADLTEDDKKRILEWAIRRYPHLTRKDLRGYTNACLAYFDASGNKQGYHDWCRVVQTWIRKGEEMKAEREAKHRYEPTVGEEAALARGELVHVDNVIDMAAKRLSVDASRMHEAMDLIRAEQSGQTEKKKG